MFRILWRILVFVGLTILTQLGGIAYLIGLAARRPWIVGVLAYVAFSLAAVLVAPQFGRVALACFTGEPRVASPLTCALNRHYATPKAFEVVSELGAAVPGTLILDANFPFWDGFPLLPHLSHDDGRKIDIAL